MKNGFFLLLVISILMFQGCSGGDTGERMMVEVNGSNQKRLANLYAMFRAENDFRGPNDEAEFKAFLNEKLTPDQKERMQISGTIDELFVNERDGQPFKIRWGVGGSPRGGATVPIIFEAVGENGVRIVSFSATRQEEVKDDARFDELWTMTENDVQQRQEATIPVDE